MATSCDWLSAQALVGDIQDKKLNVTNVVAQCINVCDIAFRSKRSVSVSLWQYVNRLTLANNFAGDRWTGSK